MGILLAVSKEYHIRPSDLLTDDMSYAELNLMATSPESIAESLRQDEGRKTAEEWAQLKKMGINPLKMIK